MSDGEVWFDPTSDKWVLRDGEHYLEVPHWAREIIADEFERETRQLKAENAKLRELVRTIYMCSNIRCNECEYDKYGQSNICTFDAEAELRELGVEV